MEEGMSKRILTIMVVAASLVGANSAFASRARQQVLGTSNPIGVIDRGSFFVDDNQNIFFNPAYVNNFRNWAAIEKSNGVVGAGASAEGGFVTSITNFNLGVYMNRGGAVPVAKYPGNTPVRPIDIFFGGDMGMKWGVGLTYGGARTGDDNSSTDLTARLGLDMAGLEPYLAYKIIGKNQTGAGDANSRKNTDLQAGVRYKFGEWTPFAAFRMTGAKLGTADSATDYTGFGLGVGRNARVAEGVRLNYAVSAWRSGKANRNVIPLDVSAEGDVTSWLVLRAGLSYRLIDRAANVTQGDTTTGRIGASINVGKVGFDWAVGHAANAETVDGQAFDFSNGMFSTASLNYRW